MDNVSKLTYVLVIMYSSSMIYTQKVDISPIGLNPTVNRYKQIDFSVPKMIEPNILIVPWPEEESRLLASIRPFQPAVWLCLGISIVVLIPFLTFLSGFYLRFIGPDDRRRQPIMSFAGLLHNGAFLLPI